MKKMFGFLLTVVFTMFLLWIGFKLTGALITACLWLMIGLPVSIVMLVLGGLLCCTIILIPLGLICMKAGMFFLVPVR